jgi:hypothetical protein
VANKSCGPLLPIHPLAENLHVKKGKPVLHMQRKMNTNKTGVNIYSSIFCNTEHYYL